MTEPIATFSFPTPTIVGPGSTRDLPKRMETLGVRRPLIVTDAGLLPTNAFASLKSTLGSETDHAVFSGVHPNPLEQDLRDAHAAYLENKCDGVIAFGGGSALDVGKAVRLLIRDPVTDLDAFDYRNELGRLAPCICIPTTAGTGSEVGRSSVVTLKSTGRKTVFFHPSLLADLVFLDAEMTRDLPQRLTAATGLDALTHCIESFTSPVFHPYCDGIALEGVHLVVNWLPKACADGANLEARTNMLVAAAMGAIAFQKDLGAAHSMAHPLSTVCGVHHGTANALCLPTVMRFNADRKPGIYRRIGIACGCDVISATDADADTITIAFVSKLIADLGIDGGLGAFGVEESKISLLAREAFADGCHLTNPVSVTESDFVNLYKSAL